MSTSRQADDHGHAHNPEHDHDPAEDHDGDARRAGLTARVAALEAILTERGLVREQQVDEIIDFYSSELSPQHGARLVARAWRDADFKARLLEDATAVVRAEGYDLDGGSHRDLPFLELRVVENTPEIHNVIVCTLCSCYPVALMGPPPRWYKSLEYRSRTVQQPRTVLREFGLELPDDITIRVWDSTAETRYLVLPQAPSGSDGLSEQALMAMVSREALIGVAVARDG